MKHYRTDNWIEFRNSIVELDGNKCSVCGISGKDVVLQVHHKKYISGLMPWEYATKDCVTLCRGCHASEHGIIKPKFGWKYQGDEDLGDLIGTCENCGSSLRYVFYVFHENWGSMEVGTYCCDSLTDTKIASNLVESQRRYEDRKERFLKSKKWKQENNTHKIRLSRFDIEITQIDLVFFIKIYGYESKKTYKSLNDAKTKAFDVIESGLLVEYFKSHNISFEIVKKGRKKKSKENVSL